MITGRQSTSLAASNRERVMDYQQALQEHYKAIRARLMPPMKPVVRIPPPAPGAKKAEEPKKVEMPVVDINGEPDVSHLSRAQIVKMCADEYGVTLEDILGHSRKTSIVLARRKAAWLLYSRGKVSTTMVGDYLNKDHTTIIHALRRYEEDRARERAKRAAEQGTGGSP